MCVFITFGGITQAVILNKQTTKILGIRNIKQMKPKAHIQKLSAICKNNN